MLQSGDTIIYAREDAGGNVFYENPQNGQQVGWGLTPGEVITVGTDMPVEFCRRLVEDGICRVFETK